MKRKQILIAALLTAVSSVAGEKALQLKLTDGSHAAYVLSDRPSVTFAGSTMTVSVPGASATYERSEIASMGFTDYLSTVIEEFSDTVSLMRYVGGAVEAPGRTIEVYTADGRLAASAQDYLSTDALPTGIYIVKAGRQTLKIAR